MDLQGSGVRGREVVEVRVLSSAAFPEGPAFRTRSGDDGKSLAEALRWLTPRSRRLYSAC
jgi:hypothetical protein